MSRKHSNTVLANADKYYIDSEKLDLINFSLTEKTRELENLYKELNALIKELDGTNKTWKGKAQRAFYDYYTRVSAHFPDIVDQLNAYSLFLAETIETYEAREREISDDAEENRNNLDINE